MFSKKNYIDKTHILTHNTDMLYTLQNIEDQYRALQEHDIRAQKIVCNHAPAKPGVVTLRAVLAERTVSMRFVLAPCGGFELESVRK